MKYFPYDDVALHDDVMGILPEAARQYIEKRQAPGKVKAILAQKENNAIYLICQGDHSECSVVKVDETNEAKLKFTMHLHALFAKAGVAPALRYFAMVDTNQALIDMDCVDGSMRQWLQIQRERPELDAVWTWIETTLTDMHRGAYGPVLTHGDLHWGNVCYNTVTPATSKQQAKNPFRPIVPILLDFDWSSINDTKNVFLHIDLLQLIRTTLWWVKGHNQTFFLGKLIPWVMAVCPLARPWFQDYQVGVPLAEQRGPMYNPHDDFATFEQVYQPTYDVYDHYCLETKQGNYGRPTPKANKTHGRLATRKVKV